MRWERLFDDLEAQVAEAEVEQLRAEVADRTRREVAQLRLVDRLRAAQGCPLTVRVLGVGPVRGTVRAAGPEWVLLAAGSVETLVPLASLTAVEGLGRQASVPGSEGAVAGRLGLGYVLRCVARDRSEVVVTLTDSTTLTGTVDRVGADHFDIHEQPGHSAPRTVPFDGLAALRRSP